MSLLEVDDISVRFGGIVALDGLSFTIEPETICSLIGPNGAGKTTLFSLITHLYDSRAGRIRIAGYDLKVAPCRALAALGVVFQQPTLDLDLTVRQNLRYHAALHGLSHREAASRIQEELERQGIFERAGEKVRQLNGGHRRRVEIARALLHRPRLLLLDEPTVGLDVPSRKAIVEHVHDLTHSGQIAVLWATHLIDEIRDGDQLIVLHAGRVRAQGGIDAVLAETGTASIGAAFEQLTPAWREAA